jgi:tRNA nucleotidyltransferase (CCA-adding enzyme)
MASDRKPSLLARLPPARLAHLRQVQQKASELGLPVYLVGGFVRDLILGRPPGDFDFVVEPLPESAGARRGRAPAQVLARGLAGEHGGHVTHHLDFGTATWHHLAGDSLDFATARTETYAYPGALPAVSWPAGIEEDLGRRDFTINAIALRVDGDKLGQPLDPFHGRADLKAGLIRVLHPASFHDDPTRLLRAFRHTGRLGFRLSDDTLALVEPALAEIPTLSGERLRHELELVFHEQHAPRILADLDALGVLQAVHPALAWRQAQADCARVIDDLPRPEWMAAGSLNRVAAFLALLLASAGPQQAADALRRLSATREDLEAVLAALQLRLETRAPSQAVAALDGLSESALTTAYVLHPSARQTLDAYLARWRHVRAQMTGDDLIELGLAPGPDFRRILWRLRAARLDGEVSDAEGELALVRQLARLE